MHPQLYVQSIYSLSFNPPPFQAANPQTPFPPSSECTVRARFKSRGQTDVFFFLAKGRPVAAPEIQLSPFNVRSLRLLG